MQVACSWQDHSQNELRFGPGGLPGPPGRHRCAVLDSNLGKVISCISCHACMGLQLYDPALLHAAWSPWACTSKMLQSLIAWSARVQCHTQLDRPDHTLRFMKQQA